MTTAAARSQSGAYIYSSGLVALKITRPVHLGLKSYKMEVQLVSLDGPQLMVHSKSLSVLPSLNKLGNGAQKTGKFLVCACALVILLQMTTRRY